MAPACTLILHRGTFVAWNSQMFRRNRGAWLPGNRIITVMENAPNQSLRLVENWTSKSAGICYSGFDIADRFLFFSSQIGESVVPRSLGLNMGLVILVSWHHERLVTLSKMHLFQAIYKKIWTWTIGCCPRLLATVWRDSLFAVGTGTIFLPPF